VLFLAGRTSSPPEVIVIGVEPAVIDWGTELSPEVAVAVPAVLAAIGAEAELHLAPRMASSRP